MATNIRTIFKNMSWLLISQIITSVLSFVWTILTARYLGVSDYGILGFAISLSGMFGVLCDLGISTHIVRSVSTDYTIGPKYLGNAIPLKILLSVLYLAIVYVILLAMGCGWVTIYITLLFVLENCLKGITNLFNGIFQAHEEGKYQAISNALLSFLTMGAILVAIYLNLGLDGITWGYVLANAGALLYAFFPLLKMVKIRRINFDFGFWKQLIKWGVPFAVTGIFASIYYYIDIVMLTQLVNDFATGIYNATYKLINVLTLFYSIYSAVIFPVMSKQFKSEKSLLVASFEKSTKYMTMVTVPICVATFFYATDVMHLIYGSQYSDGGVVLQVLIWSVCFMFINGAASNALNASHKEVSVTKIYLAACVFNAALNLFMIPAFSYIGAAASTVISEILILILDLKVLKGIKLLPKQKHLIYDIIKILISSLILGVVLWILKLNMWVAIPVAIVVYLLALFITKSFDEDDKYIIKQIIGR